MKPWLKVLLVTLLVAVPALPLGQMLWPTPADVTTGTGGMPAYVPFLILISVFEALSLGLGVAFLAFGLPLVRRIGVWSPALTWATFLSITWFLVSWWPHDGFHRSLGVNMWGLVAIEYAFHVTLIGAGVILALAFARLLQQAGAPARTAPAPAHPGLADARR
jgi:hypothetical protein